jgi:hypothetical protein
MVSIYYVLLVVLHLLHVLSLLFYGVSELPFHRWHLLLFFVWRQLVKLALVGRVR